jgi:hypothetical protein
MPTETDKLFIGTWRKASRDACAARYPAMVRFDPNGIYAGEAQTAGEFTWWDSGTWNVTKPGDLAMSVANDAVEHYRFKVETRVLTVTDNQGCVIRYEREP